MPVPVYKDLKLPTNARSYILSGDGHPDEQGYSSHLKDSERSNIITPSIEVTMDESDQVETDLTTQFSGINLGVSQDMVFSGW